MIKVLELESYIDELQEDLPESLPNLLSSKKDQRIIERVLQIMIECVIDISLLLIKELHLGPPQNEENIFNLLKNHLSNYTQLNEMRGFRNILVQRYGIIDPSLMYQFATEDLDDFRTFITDVKNIIQDQKEN